MHLACRCLVGLVVEEEDLVVEGDLVVEEDLVVEDLEVPVDFQTFPTSLHNTNNNNNNNNNKVPLVCLRCPLMHN